MSTSCQLEGDDSPQVGDVVVTVRDALLELQMGKRAARTWCFVPAGTRGELLKREDGFGKVYVREGPFARDYLWVATRTLARVGSVASLRR
jgi:hypothetical protein